MWRKTMVTAEVVQGAVVRVHDAWGGWIEEIIVAKCFSMAVCSPVKENQGRGLAARRGEEGPAEEGSGARGSREGRVAGQRRRSRPVGREIRWRQRSALFPSRREVEDGLGDLVVNAEKFRGLSVK